MDIVSRRGLLHKVLNEKLGIADLEAHVWTFLLEYFFIENNVCTFVDEKTYLRILTFQTACYLEDSIQSLKPLKRKRAGNKIKYENPQLVTNNNGYFRTYQDAIETVNENVFACCCGIMPCPSIHLRPDSETQEHVGMTNEEERKDALHNTRYIFAQDSRVQIYWQIEDSIYDRHYLIWGFVEDDPAFMFCIYP